MSVGRMDWKSMFVYCPETHVVRIRGWFRPDWRTEAAKEMWRRKANYRTWYRAAVASDAINAAARSGR